MIQKLNLPIAIVIASLVIALSIVYKNGAQSRSPDTARGPEGVSEKQQIYEKISELVAPSSGVELPVVWKDLGKKLVDSGTIDLEKIKALYSRRGQYGYELEQLLTDSDNGKLVITRDNSAYILNLLWALGLASKNPVLDSGDMVNPKYGGAGNFAATGGWSLAKGDSMDHYSRHKFFDLTQTDEAKVKRVAKGIYRPCCNNSTYFPDCNHGMAMLGLLELMASQGVSETDMYKVALAVNSYWFTDTYTTIATYKKSKSIEWKDVNPSEVLGLDYSSAYGFKRVSSEVSAPQGSNGGSSCAVAGEEPAAPKGQQSGCGI